MYYHLMTKPEDIDKVSWALCLLHVNAVLRFVVTFLITLHALFYSCYVNDALFCWDSIDTLNTIVMVLLLGCYGIVTWMSLRHQHHHSHCGPIIIIMVIFKCYFSGELIALSYIKKQQQRCEHRIRKNKQIKITVHDGNKKMK